MLISRKAAPARSDCPALFNASERADKPFVTVNCGALPETLLESELLAGYKVGAFTDARKDKIGRFAAAEGGDLFLDEIGDPARGAGQTVAGAAGTDLRTTGLQHPCQG